MWFLVAALVPIVLAFAAWGPGNHLEFEARVYRRRKELLPARIADLIEAERPAWQYGHIAADIINFKAFGGHYNHCHRWTIVDSMLGLARSPAEEAFVLGYLSHLAADTIAHNHFVPYHLARYARGQTLGHLYWEANADRFVAEDRWHAITVLKWDHRLARLDELVNSTVPRKMLSMGTNKLIFNHVLLSSERKLWRKNIERFHPRKQLRLERRFLDMFQRAAVERVALALRRDGRAKLVHVDTNGKQAQELALTLRNAIVERFAAGEAREAALEKAASVFLEGMQSPPPKTDGGRKAVWLRAK
ncbi:MAG: zinc dependent phospholipase C family protein [Planctomycetes bacterium]|nr:zinc dependent phospholipase C family protein [Planctomycetota bacterium]